MEYGNAVPLTTPAEDDGRTTMQTGGPSFAAHADGFTFVQTSWKDLPVATRDQLRSLQRWLKRDLGIQFDLSFFREEKDPLYAKMAMTVERARQLANPHAIPKAQRDAVPWNGQITSGRPEFVRLDVGRPLESMLQTEAHEARHVFQLVRRDEFIKGVLLKSGVSEAALNDDGALVDFLEQDAARYAPRAVARWRKGTR